jgi:AraC family ethanolamine operon transcriptional activator
VLQQSALDKIAQIQGLDLSHFLSSPVISLKPERMQSLSYILGEFVNSDNETAPGALQQELLIMNLLDSLELFTPLDTPSSLPSFSRRKSVVEKVKNYIDEHPDKAITITELCEIAYVSRRTLQYSFETVMGINPLKYLKITRLNDVRRDLFQCADTDETIATIASRRGFWHAGQFARDYTALFGENPSVTLRRLSN